MAKDKDLWLSAAGVLAGVAAAVALTRLQSMRKPRTTRTVAVPQLQRRSLREYIKEGKVLIMQAPGKA